MTRTWVVAVAALAFLTVGTGRCAEEEAGYQLLDTIKVGGDGGWDCLTVDPVGRRLYVSRSNRAIVVDIDKNKVVGEVKNTPGIHGIAVVPRRKKGYTSNGGDSTATVFDLETLKETARPKVGSRPDIILYDPASDRVFTFNGGSKDATAIDPATDKVVGTVKLGGKPEFAVADEKGTIYVNIENTNELVAFDAKELKVVHRWPLAPGDEPSGLAIDRAKGRLFATCHNEKMVIFDAVKGKVMTTVPIGKGTDGCAFDPGTGLAFSSNGDGTLTIVALKSDGYHVLGNVKTQTRSKTMALDPKTHRCYLPAAKFKAGTRTPLPDSFVIQVFGKK